MRRVAFLCLAFFVVLLVAPLVALAETDPAVQAMINAACANNGAFLQWLAGIFGAVAGASLLANARKFLPPWAVKVLDVVALNFIKGVPPAAGVVFFVALIAGSLAACTPGTPPAPVSPTPTPIAGGATPTPTPSPAPTPAPSTGNQVLDQFAAMLQKLGSFSVADLQNAAAMAKANNDAIGGACWNGLIPVVQQLQATVTPTSGGTIGVATGIQAIRDMANLATGSNNIVSQIELACGPLQIDTNLHGAQAAVSILGILGISAPVLPAIP